VVRVGLIVGMVRKVGITHLSCPILCSGACKISVDASSNPKSLQGNDLRRDQSEHR